VDCGGLGKDSGDLDGEGDRGGGSTGGSSTTVVVCEGVWLREEMCVMVGETARWESVRMAANSSHRMYRWGRELLEREIWDTVEEQRGEDESQHVRGVATAGAEDKTVGGDRLSMLSP